MAFRLKRRPKTGKKKKFYRLHEINSLSLWERTFEGRKQTIFRKAKQLELSCGVLATVTIRSQGGICYFYSSDPDTTGLLKKCGIIDENSVNMTSLVHEISSLSEVKKSSLQRNSKETSTIPRSVPAQSSNSTKSSSTTNDGRKRPFPDWSNKRLSSVPLKKSCTKSKPCGSNPSKTCATKPQDTSRKLAQRKSPAAQTFKPPKAGSSCPFATRKSYGNAKAKLPIQILSSDEEKGPVLPSFSVPADDINLILPKSPSKPRVSANNLTSIESSSSSEDSDDSSSSESESSSESSDSSSSSSSSSSNSADEQSQSNDKNHVSYDHGMGGQFSTSWPPEEMELEFESCQQKCDSEKVSSCSNSAMNPTFLSSKVNSSSSSSKVNSSSVSSSKVNPSSLLCAKVNPSSLSSSKVNPSSVSSSKVNPSSDLSSNVNPSTISGCNVNPSVVSNSKVNLPSRAKSHDDCNFIIVEDLAEGDYRSDDFLTDELPALDSSKSSQHDNVAKTTQSSNPKRAEYENVTRCKTDSVTIDNENKNCNAFGMDEYEEKKPIIFIPENLGESGDDKSTSDKFSCVKDIKIEVTDDNHFTVVKQDDSVSHDHQKPSDSLPVISFKNASKENEGCKLVITEVTSLKKAKSGKGFHPTTPRKDGEINEKQKLAERNRSFSGRDNARGARSPYKRTTSHKTFSETNRSKDIPRNLNRATNHRKTDRRDRSNTQRANWKQADHYRRPYFRDQVNNCQPKKQPFSSRPYDSNLSPMHRKETPLDKTKLDTDDKSLSVLATWCKQAYETAFSPQFLDVNRGFRRLVEKSQQSRGHLLLFSILHWHKKHFHALRLYLKNTLKTRSELEDFLFKVLSSSMMFSVVKNHKGRPCLMMKPT